MAKDWALLEALKKGTGGPVVRLYSWNQTCITVGFGLSVEKVLAKGFGWPVARRPTGGGLVVHEPKGEVTLAAASWRPRGKSLNDLYRMVHEPIFWALRELGYPVLMITGCVAEPTKNVLPVCFDDAPCLYDGVLAGKKVLGGGLRVAGQYFLYQGTIKIPLLTQRTLFAKLKECPLWDSGFLQEEPAVALFH
ncbi:MAG: hypothetical protein HY401_02700 [Elusimicrobia bacterium]|nr:hypothetical protein [Elusimicrobiota bacterium]